MQDSNIPSPAAAAVAAVAPEVKTETPTDPRLEALAQKERQLHKMRQQIQAERKALEAKDADYKTNYITKARLTEDPLSVLAESGISYEKITEMLLSGHNSQDPAIKAIRAEIKALKDAEVEKSKQAEASVKQQYDQALKQIRNEVKLLVSANDEYATTREARMEDAVVELIEQTFNSEGRLMDIDEAAKEVESYLIEELKSTSKLKKIQDALNPKTEDTVVNAQTSPSLKTLTNAVSQQVPKRTSEKERRERALAAFAGKLNQ